jgi:hypothetical protein
LSCSTHKFVKEIISFRNTRQTPDSNKELTYQLHQLSNLMD